MLRKVDPPKGMLEYATSRNPWFVTLWTTANESHETMPYRVTAVYQEARQISIEGVDGTHLRVPVERICSHFRDLT